MKRKILIAGLALVTLSACSASDWDAMNAGVQSYRRSNPSPTYTYQRSPSVYSSSSTRRSSTRNADRLCIAYNGRCSDGRPLPKSSSSGGSTRSKGI